MKSKLNKTVNLSGYINLYIVHVFDKENLDVIDTCLVNAKTEK